MSCPFDDDRDRDDDNGRNRRRNRECSFEDILESLDGLNNRQLCTLLRRIRRILACGF